MPPELFKLPVFTGTNIVTLFLYGALAGMFFLLPFDLQARRGLTASEAGLTMLPIGIIIGVLSRLMGGWADRLGPRPFLVIGPVLVGLCGVGLALNLSELLDRRAAPSAPLLGGHGDRRLAADDGGDELGAGRALRRRLRRQQCREPDSRRARHRSLRRGGRSGLRLERCTAVALASCRRRAMHRARRSSTPSWLPIPRRWASRRCGASSPLSPPISRCPRNHRKKRRLDRIAWLKGDCARHRHRSRSTRWTRANSSA